MDQVSVSVKNNPQEKYTHEKVPMIHRLWIAILP